MRFHFFILGLFLAVCGFHSAAFAQQDENFSKPVLIEFKDQIDPASYQYFRRKLAKAEAAKADLLVIQINSPGGTLEESLKIAEELRDVKWAKTVAFIPEKALSGAALASLGCDEIIINSVGRIGDAGIIFMDQTFAFHYAPEKAITDLVRRARDLAEFKGRPPALAEAMIDMDTLVFQNKDNPRVFETRRAKNSGYPHRQQAGDDPNAFQKKLDLDKWSLVEESNEGRFLEVNGNRAVELGMADANASSIAELKERFNLESDFTIYKKTATDVAIFWLNLPIITGLLFVLGLIALYLEFSAPGIGIGALFAFLCFALFFWSHFLGGTAGWLEVVLFMSGIAFLLMELFVIPGLTGIILMVVSVMMASQDFIIPQTDSQMKTVKSNLLMIAGSGAAFLVCAYFVSKFLGRVPLVSNLMLAPPTQEELQTDKDAKSPVQDHAVVAIGDWGVAESVLRPAGKAKFGDQIVDVVADGSFIQPNEQVKVIEISGNRVMVVKA